MASVYEEQSMGMANLRIALVHDRGRADLLACRVYSYGAAVGESLWFMTTSRQSADVIAFFCSEGFAQLKVCFVPTRGEAGWVQPHPLRGRLRRR